MRRVKRLLRRLAPLLVGLVAAGLLVASPFGAAAARPEPPLTTTRAEVVLDAESGAVLHGKDQHDRLPPASLTKMTTALVALQRAGESRPILATERSLVEPSVIGLEPGDRLPLGEALYGLLLNSGNDAALAIAESLGDGSIDRFVGWMNDLVGSLGLRDTHFANPHGLDYGDHYSSAYDLAVIGRVLLEQPELRAIVATERHEFAGPPRWVFHNSNPLLGVYPGVDGLKTGYETRAGRCLAVSAGRGRARLIVVVLHSEQPAQDAAALLDYGFARLVVERPADSQSNGGATSITNPTARSFSAGGGSAAAGSL